MEYERYVVVLYNGSKPEIFKNQIKGFMKVISVWKILPCLTVLANIADIEYLRSFEEVKFILRSTRD